MIASNYFKYDDEVEITFDCPLKGYKGQLVYVSDESLQIEVNINNEDERGYYFRGLATDVRKLA
jgi:hypothetical protein